MNRPLRAFFPNFFPVFVISVVFFVPNFPESAFAEKPPLPSPVIPEGLGYNIHFTDPKPGEMEMLAASGAKIVRMDFSWSATEQEKGVYDFSAFDRLTGVLETHGVRPLYILDYSNRHYDGGFSPAGDTGRKAFAKWAAAGVGRFKNRGILWEMYNEPNIHFWKPQPDPEAYVALALETGRAIREVAPDELYIGPATSEIDLDFLETCFKSGLLEYWDAVSVHPYRQKDPETVVPEYAKLRYLIDRYAPEGKTVPILSAEWGYSVAWNHYSDEIQGRMLPRQWMVNLACGVPVSIWYDWHDDGPDPKEPEHNFGTVSHPYNGDREPVYIPKPAYFAAKTFCETFRGFVYNKRIRAADDSADPECFIFLFGKHDEVRLAAWTVSKESKSLRIPCDPGRFRVLSHLGGELPDATAGKDGLELTVTENPIYLIPCGQNEFLKRIAALPSLPLCVYFSSTAPPHIVPAASFTRRAEPYRLSSIRKIDGRTVAQDVTCIVDDPVRIHYEIANDEIVFHLENPSKNPFRGELRIVSRPGEENVSKFDVDLTRKTGRIRVTHPIARCGDGFHRFSYRLGTDADGIFETQTVRSLDDFGRYTPEGFSHSWRVTPDGDAAVASEQTLKLGKDATAEITYRFDEGWKFLNISPKNDELRKISGRPDEMKLRVESDGSGNVIRMRFRDAEGQTFQVDGGTLAETGPMFFTFDLLDKNNSFWGGPNDGVIREPIVFDSIIIDGARKKTGPHTLGIGSPVWRYSRDESDFPVN